MHDDVFWSRVLPCSLYCVTCHSYQHDNRVCSIIGVKAMRHMEDERASKALERHTAQIHRGRVAQHLQPGLVSIFSIAPSPLRAMTAGWLHAIAGPLRAMTAG